MTDEHRTEEESIDERARDAIRESEIRLRTAVESLPFDFFLIGPDGRYVMQNSACRRNWGDAVGKRPRDICPDDCTWALWDANNRRAFAGEVVEGEVAFESPAGTRHCYNIISPIRDGDEIRGILGVNIDITVRKQAEQALQRLNDELEERVAERTAQLEASNRRLEAEMEHREQATKELQAYQEHMARAERLASLGALSAMLAHEMNQPLTVIRLTIQDCLAQLKSDGPGPELVADLELCLEEVSTVASIVDRFRSFARESSRGRTARLNLHEVARKVLRIWEESARKARVTFSLEGLDKLPDVYLDERDIEQLFFVLVENAVQAADGRGERRLDIRGVVRDEVIELAFADDCGGIAPKHVGRIFEPFFTTKDSEQATGLGLCIVQHVLDKIGGKIRVDNRPGVGVTFIVTLPLDSGMRRTG
jgi:PAS domain S-box-containing protein